MITRSKPELPLVAGWDAQPQMDGFSSTLMRTRQDLSQGSLTDVTGHLLCRRPAHSESATRLRSSPNLHSKHSPHLCLGMLPTGHVPTDD